MIHHSMPTIGLKEKHAVNRVLSTGLISQGREVALFEDQLARRVKRKHAAAVSSGTAALYAGLVALGIGKKKQVIIPSFCCASLLQAVMMTGAEPVVADINPDDYAISFEQVKKKTNKKTAAVIVAHMFGCPADMRFFTSLTIPVIEDCAQCFGGHVQNRVTGSLGKVSIFSFYATKLITTGEGGMVVSDNKHDIDTIKDMRSCDNKKDLKMRFNFKMNDMQAAMGRAQLQQLEPLIKKRKAIANIYTRLFSRYWNVAVPQHMSGRDHVFFRYVIRTSKNAGSIVAEYRRRGIEACRPVPVPLHRIVGLPDRAFLDTMQAYNHAVSIPLYPSMTGRQINKIIAATERIFGS